MKIPKLLQAVLIIVGVYAAFKIIFGVILGQLIPSSLLTMYMFFVIVGVLWYTPLPRRGRKLLQRR
jgi:hypothetical protein